MLERAIEQYGYLAVLVGTFFEGETVLLLGGFAAHRGYLALGGVAAAAFAGSVAGDWLYFEIGRRRGAAFLAKRPAWQARVAALQTRVRKNETLLILGFRFLYGIRTVAPFALGASGVPPLRFALLNAIAAAIWSIAFASLGYALGNTLEAVLGDLARYERAVFAAIALAGAATWLWRRRRQGTVPV
jgi:membrane protein DedA with SNARE-associated domain